MIDAQEDVLDTQNAVGRCHVSHGGSLGNDEGRLGGREPLHLGEAIALFHTHQHIGQRSLQAVDTESPPGQTAWTVHRPALGGGASSKIVRAWFGFQTRRRQPGSQTEPPLAPGRYTPHDLESVFGHLLQGQVAGAHLMGVAGAVGQQQQQPQQEKNERAAIHCRAPTGTALAASAASPSRPSTSMT